MLLILIDTLLQGPGVEIVSRWCLTSLAWEATCCAFSSTTRHHVRLAAS